MNKSQANAVNAVITRDDGRNGDYHTSCPYCGYVTQMTKVRGPYASFGNSHSHTICQNCGKSFEVILEENNLINIK